jgi:glucose/arabinose dehydrogenase
MPRPLRITLWILLAVAGAAVLLVTWFLWFGPVAISDRAMLWRMIRGTPAEPPSAQVVASQLTVPPGYRIAIWARDLPSVRLLRPLPDGSLVATQPRGGRVVLLRPDRNGDGGSDAAELLLEGLDGPNGVDVSGGFLYVAERTAVGRAPFDEATGRVTGDYSRIVTGLTGDGGHWRKALRIGPDGGLYVGLGSTCNVCVEKDPRRAAIMRFEADGSAGRVYATGLRNPYGFDWSPWDGALYATENSRDLLGDDIPPDELNRIEEGAFYGWPWRHGAGIVDPDMDPGPAALLASARPPAHAFRAHNAPLGIRFLRHPANAPGYARAALVALHGSWNRSVPDGYAVVSLHWGEDGRIEERTFVGGFRGPAGLIGRPVDVAEAADGAIFVSDDYAGVIYRVAHAAR